MRGIRGMREILVNHSQGVIWGMQVVRRMCIIHVSQATGNGKGDGGMREILVSQASGGIVEDACNTGVSGDGQIYAGKNGWGGE